MPRAIVALALVLGCSDPPATPPTAPAPPGPTGTVPRGTLPRRPGEVVLRGSVREQFTTTPIPNIAVVFFDGLAEARTTTTFDGSFEIAIPAGRYWVFADGPDHLSVARPDPVRLPDGPTAELAGALDEGLAPLIDARADAHGIELTVMPATIRDGVVLDRAGRAVARAVVHARGLLRPVHGTDIAVTDAAGAFTLQLAPGDYQVEVTHDQFAGLDREPAVLNARAGSRIVGLVAGCVITGRVVGPDGRPTGEGAIEQRFGPNANDFAAAGRITADGRFRWATTDEAEVALRAWPWKSAPSPARTFRCREGKRYDDVVFTLPSAVPDLDGILVDAAGHEMPFAYLDIVPLDGDVQGQQERTDASGRWQVYALPPGRYVARAAVPGKGVVSSVLVAPSRGAELKLAGTGRVEGRTTTLVDGSFELTGATCTDALRGTQVLVEQHRIVVVRGGTFTIDDLPACELVALATWRDQQVKLAVVIPTGGVARTELDLGPVRPKEVHGVVRDERGAPVANATVTASSKRARDVVARTDREGRYRVTTIAGASLAAGAHGKVGYAEVGTANVVDERVDLALTADPSD